MIETYITVAELRIEPYVITVSDASDEYLENVLLPLTKSFLDRVCRQSFSKEGTAEIPVEKKVDGTGKDTIFLPKKLVTLNKIRIYTSSTNYTDYTADNFTVKQKFISWNIYSESFDTARLRVENFSKGVYNIGVLGIWGWESPPEAIKYAQGKLIVKILTDGEFAEKFKTERVGDYDSTLNTNEKSITGNTELDLIIKQYRSSMTYAAI